MKRRGFTLPLLIGGATTSAKHTAVKIAPQYEQPTVHVLDASRCVGVVDRLMSDDRRPQLLKENKELQRQLAESYKQRDVKLTPLAEARARRFQTDWKYVEIPTPSFTGVSVLRDYPLAEIARYIDWSPFFLTYEMKGKYPRIFDDPGVGPHARLLFEEAQQMLKRIIDERLLTANSVYGFWPANSDGDDIALQSGVRLHTLRQQLERQGQK